jgi:GNAT superfamily N-acetyltransferase
MNLEKHNIDNLCAFWESTGSALHAGCLQISNTWPNKFWFNFDYLNDDNDDHQQDSVVNILKDVNKVIRDGSMCPAWGKIEQTRKEIEDILCSLGCEYRFQQTLMHKAMSEYTPTSVNRDQSFVVSRAQSQDDIQKFCEVCSLCFGYHIDLESMINAAQNPNTHILVGYHGDGIPVATSVLFQTGNTIGIFQVGVLPSYRRQGIARNLMLQVLDIGNEIFEGYLQMMSEGCESDNSVLKDQMRSCSRENCYMTLQAGDSAKELYLSLGFKERFAYRNFILKANS